MVYLCQDHQRNVGPSKLSIPKLAGKLKLGSMKYSDYGMLL